MNKLELIEMMKDRIALSSSEINDLKDEYIESDDRGNLSRVIIEKQFHRDDLELILNALNNLEQ
jgi:hypothetical protein